MDQRDFKPLPGGWTADHETMTLTDEHNGVTHAAEYEVCGTCEGRGRHVNPAINRNGITQETFDDDPEFFEAYRRGDYDVPCSACQGRRVVLVPKSPEGKAALHSAWGAEYDYAAEVEAERRMGA
jgi:hypothetical protein